MDAALEAQVTRARELVDRSERVVVLTGAGISTDSGIPDYRGPQGVWTKNPAAEKLSTLQNYLSDPEIRRTAWQRRLALNALRAEPNSGHYAVVELERRGKLHALLTQNIDGLHQRAGSSPSKVVEVHGTIHEVVCMVCGARGPMERTLDRVRAGEADPPCLDCGGILKSATVSFGQSLVHADLMRADRAAKTCDLMLAVGSTLSVMPIAMVVPTAHEHGANVIIVNGEPTAMDDLADVNLRGSIGELLPRLLELVREPEPGVGAP